MVLPVFQSLIKELALLQTSWSSRLNPLLSNPLLNGLLLPSVALQTGDNVINHRLGRPLQGWALVRQYEAYAGLYDKQASNQMTSLTLILNADGPTTVDLYVF